MSRVLSIPNLQALYDPSDLTSIYQSRTGGSPGAVNSVVGIMLDKAQMGNKTAAAFIAGQAESAPNSGTSLTGWTPTTTNGGQVTSTGSGIRLQTDASGTQFAGFAISPSSGVWYLVSATIEVISGIVAVQTGTIATNTSGTGVQAITFLAYKASGTVEFKRSGASVDAYVRNISIKAIPGSHALAPSDAARPILKTGYIDFDGADDVLNAVIGANLGAACSVYHRTQAGSNVWLDAQTINAGNYAMSTTDWRKAAIFSSEPSAANKAIVEAWGAS